VRSALSVNGDAERIAERFSLTFQGGLLVSREKSGSKLGTR